MSDVVLHRVWPGRTRRGDLGLAARRADEHDRGALHGRDRIRLPDRRRPLLLGVEAREPRLGLVHWVVQPDRSDRGHGGHRLWARNLRDRAAQLLVRLSEHQGVHLPPVRDLPGGGARHQSAERSDHVAAEHGFRLLAHGRRSRDRRHPHRRPRQSPVVRLRLRGNSERHRVRNRQRRLLEPGLPVRLRDGPPDGPVHDHRVRRVGAHGRGDESGVAVGRRRHVHVGRGLRGLRILPARRRHIRGTEHGRGDREPRLPSALHLGRVDEPELGGIPSLHLRDRTVLLRYRLDHVGVADALRLLARRRRARSSLVAAGRSEPGSADLRRGHRRRLGSDHGACVLELPRRLSRRHGYRSDRPVRGLHPPRDPPLPARRPLRARRVEPRAPLQVDRHRGDRLGCVHHTRLLAPALQGERSLVRRVQLGSAQLRADPRRRGPAPLRRGMCFPHTSGSKARSAWAPRKNSSVTRKSSRPGRGLRLPRPSAPARA